MKKLTKGFEASTARVNINVDGQVYEAANLRKGGILHNNIILVGQEDRWLEVDCVKLCISNDLVTFKNLVATGEITPSDLGLYKDNLEPPKQYGLRHEDFVKLEGLFPAYPYFMISHLFNHLTKSGRKSCYDDLRDFMKQVAASGKNIHDWIRDSENNNTFFVEGVKNNEPFSVKINDGDISFTYWISKTGDKIKYYSVFNNGDESISDPGAEYETIKQAERQCLSKALVAIKSMIVNADNPQAYYVIFNKIQNKFKIINMNEKTKIRESQLVELGLMFNPTEDSYTGHGFTVTGNSIENDSDEEFQNLLDRIDSQLLEETGIIHNAEQSESFPAQSPEPLPTAPPAPQQGGSMDVRIKELIDIGLKYDGDRTFSLTAKTGYIAVDILDVQTYSDRKWTGLMIDIGKMLKGEPTESVEEAPAPPAPEVPIIPPVAEAPAKKPLSLATIGNISTDRISELQDLEKSQIEVLEKHKFVKPVDAKTLKQAKANVTALRKASTGTEKIEKDASKFLNTLKTAIKNVVDKAAKLTRDALDKQEQAVKEYENAEALRLAAEQKARLEKIKQRTDTLFAIPMVFTGSLGYNIGTLYIMPTQIELSTDEEFNGLVIQAQTIKKTLDAQAETEKSKEAELEAARKKIAELTGEPYVAPTGEVVPPPVAPPAPPTVEAAAEMIDKVIPPATIAPAPPVVNNTAPPAPPATTSGSSPYNYQLSYVEALPGNTMLHKLDMENLSALENVNYLKARAYFIRGTKDVAQSIQDILNAPTQEGVKKSEQIAALCQTILNQ